MNARLSIWRGDATALSVDALAVSANPYLTSLGGVNGVVHSVRGWPPVGARKNRRPHTPPPPPQPFSWWIAQAAGPELETELRAQWKNQLALARTAGLEM